MGTFDSVKTHIQKIIEYRSNSDLYLDHLSSQDVVAASANWLSLVEAVETLYAGLDILPNERFVPPSGDITGVTDTENIQGAIDELQAEYAAGYWNPQRRIILSGTYYINQTITSGSNTGYVVCIAGRPSAYIRWTGIEDTHDYAFDFRGYYNRGRVVVMQDILFEGFYKCRGALFTGLPHHILTSRCSFNELWEVGIDAISSWSAVIEDTTVSNIVGIGLRTIDFNRGTIRRFQLRGYGCYHSDGILSAASTALWKYEVDNGKTAAESYYGDDYIQKWPAVDDSTVFELDGTTPVRTPETDRAGVVMHGSAVTIESCTFENSKYCEYPNLFLYGEDSAGVLTEKGLNRVNEIWMENAVNRLSKIVVLGSQYGGAFSPGMTSISRVFATDTSQDPSSCRAFVELRGVTRNVSVSDCYLTKVGEAIIYAANGTHTDPSVTGVWSYTSGVDRSNWIKAAPGATLVYKPTMCFGGIETLADGWVYLGDPTAPGTMRIGMEGSSLVVQRYEESDGGTGTGTSLDWVTKATLATP